jgi:YfiH family protein
MELFRYLGDDTFPYRTIMADHTDFSINKILILKNRCVIAEQTHSNNVHVCSEKDSGAGFDEHSQVSDCDAIVTGVPNQFLLIRTADCTPILLYDEKRKCIGAVHSGREGTRKDITGHCIEVMINEYNSQPKDVKAWIGPGICNNHYKVSEEIWAEFYQSCKNSNFFIDESDFLFPDIQNVILQQLTTAGILQENIISNNICTFESERHFSFRRNGTFNRQINIIGMIDGKHNL